MNNNNSPYGNNNMGQGNGNDNGFLGSSGGQGGYYGGYRNGGGQGGYYGGYPQGNGNPQGGGYYGGFPQGAPQSGYQQPYSNPYMQRGYNNIGSGGGDTVRNIPIIPNNAVNYIIFLPFFALVLENFAMALPLGVLLWGLVIFFMRYAAYQDAKAAVEKNILQESSKTVALISPVVYIYQRSQALNRGMGKMVLVCIAVFAAIFYNGFTRSATVTPQGFIATVQSTYLSQLGIYDELENYSENYQVSESVDAFVEAQDWSYSEFDDKKCVILKGTFKDTAPDDYRGKEIELKFESDFDGYNIKTMSFNIGECKLDGDELSGEKKESLEKGLFHDWELPEDDEEQDDDSSETEPAKARDKDTYDA